MNTDLFFKGFEKAAKETTYLRDLSGGIDPTGVVTFQAGKKNEIESSKRHGKHRAIATAGGVLGGAGVVAPLLSGTMRGVSSGLSARGGLKGKALSAAKGFVQGVKQPFTDTYHGLRGGAKLMKGNAAGAERHIEHFTGAIPDEAVKRLSRKALAKSPHMQAELGREMFSKGLGGASSLALGGGISGTSAYLQYGAGRDTGKELRQARNKHAQAMFSGFEKAAEKEEKKKGISPAGAALGVGGAVAGGKFLADTGSTVLHERQISKLPTKTHQELLKELKPGDVLTFRDREAEIAGKGKKRLQREKFMMGMGTGSPYSHSAVYTGDGKILQAKGLVRKSKQEKLLDYVTPKEEIRVFRHKDKAQSSAAAARSANLTGIPYLADGTKSVSEYGVRQIIGGGTKPAKIPTKRMSAKAKAKCNPKSGICYPLVADAYGDKTFSKREIGYKDVAHNPQFEAVVKSTGSRKYKPQSMLRHDVFGAHVARPAINALKWGLPLAGATYGLGKAIEIVSGKKKGESAKN